MVRFRFRVYGHGFAVRLGRTNSKKIKTMGNLHMASFYVTYHVCYGSFSQKPFSEMSYEVQRCMAFDSNEIGYDL